MFQNFGLVSGLSVLILDSSDEKIESFKVYNVTRKFYEYSDYTPSLSDLICPPISNTVDLGRIWLLQILCTINCIQKKNQLEPI